MALAGRTLRVACGQWHPYVNVTTYENGTTVANGILIDVLNTLSNSLRFDYVLTEPPDGQWGRDLGNGSFSGMIGMCQRKEVDLGLGPFDVTYSRIHVASFSTYVTADYIGLFLPRPKLEKDLQGFLKPFTWQVWTGLFSCLVLSLILTMLVRCPSLLSKDQEDAGYVFKGSWIVRIFSQQAISRLPRREASRLLVATWLVATLIIASAYKGVLTSILAVPRVDIPINSLEDLVSYGRQKWALERGTSIHEAIFAASSGVYKTIAERTIFVSSCETAKNRIKSGELGVVCDFFTMRRIMHDEYSKSGQCSYYIAEVPMKKVFLSFAFQKDSALVELFNKVIYSLRESGSLSKSYFDITANATACLVRPGKEGPRSSLIFSLLDLGGVFFLLATGLGFAFLLFLTEVIGENLFPRTKDVGANDPQ